MSRALLALALGLALGSPPLQTWAAGLVQVVLASSAGADVGSLWDPNGGPQTNVGNRWDPDGGANADVGSQWDPNG